MANIIIDTSEEQRLRAELEQRHDPESERIKRYLNMPDLSRTPGSPLKDMVERILAIPDFKSLDILKVPEIVPADISFDLFDFPADHPARGHGDTYYIDEE